MFFIINKQFKCSLFIRLLKSALNQQLIFKTYFIVNSDFKLDFNCDTLHLKCTMFVTLTKLCTKTPRGELKQAVL